METQDQLHEKSVAELLRRLSRETTLLVRQETELAKAELSVKGKAIGFGAGMFGGAGVAVLIALLCLSASAIAALTATMSLPLAALTIGIVWGAAGAIMAFSGKQKIKESMPPVPTEAIESVREDIAVATNGIRRGASQGG